MRSHLGTKLLKYSRSFETILNSHASPATIFRNTHVIGVVADLFFFHSGKIENLSSNFRIRNFFFSDKATVHTHPANSTANPEKNKSALHVHDFGS